MKDEEMAEEYFKSVCEDYNEELERTGKRHYWVGFDIKNAYLAGLKARNDQLVKAKEHIRTLISCLIDWVQEGDKDYCYIADAEQFLKGENIILEDAQVGTVHLMQTKFSIKK